MSIFPKFYPSSPCELFDLFMNIFMYRLKKIKPFPFTLAGALTNHLVRWYISYIKYLLQRIGSLKYFWYYSIRGTIINFFRVTSLENHLTESWTRQCQIQSHECSFCAKMFFQLFSSTLLWPTLHFNQHLHQRFKLLLVLGSLSCKKKGQSRVLRKHLMGTAAMQCPVRLKLYQYIYLE